MAMKRRTSTWRNIFSSYFVGVFPQVLFRSFFLFSLSFFPNFLFCLSPFRVNEVSYTSLYTFVWFCVTCLTPPVRNSLLYECGVYFCV
jgi:hypothetical protein